jgi:hypothetical protein
MTTQPLTKGFQQIRFDDSLIGLAGIRETLFAVLPNGVVLKSDECAKHNAFFEKRDWKKVDSKPEGLEFIGNYRLPPTLNKLAAE